MTIIQNEIFYITGIAIRTTNENGKSSADIPKLWENFFSEQAAEKITGKISNDIYCVYTDYEKDFTRPYTTVLGCRVEKDAAVPAGFKKIEVPAGNYELFTAKGNLHENIVFNEWLGIWKLDIKRTYKADYEVYGEKAQNPAKSEVDIFVGTE